MKCDRQISPQATSVFDITHFIIREYMYAATSVFDITHIREYMYATNDIGLTYFFKIADQNPSPKSKLISQLKLTSAAS